MIATQTPATEAYRIQCASIWGGIEPVTRDVCTQGIDASIHSTASGGERGGDIYYLTVCSTDQLTRVVIADVRGHGEQVSEISSWLYQCLEDKMNSLDGAGILTDLNTMAYRRGFEAMTTAAVASYYVGDSRLYFSYAGHPPVMARKTGGHWHPLELPLELILRRGRANLPLGVLPVVRYDQSSVRMRPGDRFLLYTDGLTEASASADGEQFGEMELPALLESMADSNLTAVRDAVIERASVFAGGPIVKDDCTFLMAEVRERPF
jgi:sigma-B regulation protein RsbU (phosphoserine phosphatase)